MAADFRLQAHAQSREQGLRDEILRGRAGAWKMRGRVGDSPIIGAGLYVDNKIGAATSTGVGEEVIRNAGSFLVVELMRQGRTPLEACQEAVRRIMQRKANQDAD